MSLITQNPHNFTENEQPKQPEEKTPKQQFFDYANRLREVHAVRMKATGRGGLGGGAAWWQKMPENFRVFLLSTITDDDWERWSECAWDGLPEGLRTTIASECRALARVVDGCPWR